MAIDRVRKPRYIVGQSATATFQGPWLNVGGLDNLSFHCEWTGTLTATITLDGSNAEPVRDASTGADSPSTRLTPRTIATSTTNPAGAAGGTIFTVTGVAVEWVRLVVNVTGAGTAFSAAFKGKGL